MAEATGAELPGEPMLRLDPGMHTARLWRIDVDARERFLVTGSDDGTARVWSLADGRLLQTLRVPIGDGNLGRVYAVAISPDGERVAAGGYGTGGGRHLIYVFDRTSGRLAHRIEGQPNSVKHLAFSPDGRHLVVTLGGANGIRVYATDEFREVRSYRYGDQSYWAAFDSSGRLVTTSLDGKVRLYDREFRLLREVVAPGGKQPFGIAFSPDGSRIAVGYADSSAVDVLDGETLERLFQPDTTGVESGNLSVESGNLSKVAWAADGQVLYAGGRWRRSNQLLLRRWADGGRGRHNDFALSDDTIMDLRPLADGRLAFGSADPAFGVLGPDGALLWKKGPTRADFRGPGGVLAVSADGARIGFGLRPFGKSPARFDLLARRLTLDPPDDPDLAKARTEAAGLKLADWRDSTGPMLNGAPLPLRPLETSRSLAIAPDGERFLLGTEWYLRCFDRKGKQLWPVNPPGIAWAVNLSGDGRLALAALGDGTIRWYRLDDGKELLALYVDKGTGEEIVEENLRWVAWTLRGHYMASPGGEELIGWHVNRGLDQAPEFFKAAQFRDRFHRPDVVALALETLDPDLALTRADAAAGIQTLSAPPLAAVLPPVVRILEPIDEDQISKDPVALTYLVESHDGEPVPLVRVMVNGELALVWHEPDPAVPSAGRRTQLPVPVIARARHGVATITVVAQSERGESNPVSVRLRLAAGVARVTPQPKLWVLSIGVSNYKRNPPRNLSFAAKDAHDVLAQFQHQEGAGLYAAVKGLPLLEEEATAADIIDGLVWLQDHVEERDVVVIYLAGHGIVVRDVYYFLPYDANLSTEAARNKSTISQHELFECLSALNDKKAKVLAFFDTCYAGALGTARGGSADLERMAAALASSGNGVIVFTAASALEEAWEDPSWNNGAFTKALLEALSGAAGEGGMRYVRVSDLNRVVEQVKALTSKRQNPRIYVPSRSSSKRRSP